MRKGKKLEEKIARWLKELDIYYQRFFDARSMGGICVARPADFWIWYKGKLIFIECKECESSSLSLNNIRESQFKAMNLAKKYNYKYIILIKEKVFLYAFKSCLILDFIKKNTKKTLNREWLKDNGVVIKNKKDLKSFINNL